MLKMTSFFSTTELYIALQFVDYINHCQCSQLIYPVPFSSNFKQNSVRAEPCKQSLYHWRDAALCRISCLFVWSFSGGCKEDQAMIHCHQHETISTRKKFSMPFSHVLVYWRLFVCVCGVLVSLADNDIFFREKTVTQNSEKNLKAKNFAEKAPNIIPRNVLLREKKYCHHLLKISDSLCRFLNRMQ